MSSKHAKMTLNDIKMSSNRVKNMHKKKCTRKRGEAHRVRFQKICIKICYERIQADLRLHDYPCISSFVFLFRVFSTALIVF